jgi:predicted transcriptional regulator
MSLLIELDEQTAAAVQKLAANENRAATEVIRDALAAYSATVVKRPMPKGMGKYHSGHTDTASKARELLRGAVEKGEWP